MRKTVEYMDSHASHKELIWKHTKMPKWIPIGAIILFILLLLVMELLGFNFYIYIFSAIILLSIVLLRKKSAYDSINDTHKTKFTIFSRTDDVYIEIAKKKLKGFLIERNMFNEKKLERLRSVLLERSQGYKKVSNLHWFIPASILTAFFSTLIAWLFSNMQSLADFKIILELVWKIVLAYIVCVIAYGMAEKFYHDIVDYTSRKYKRLAEIIHELLLEVDE